MTRRSFLAAPSLAAAASAAPARQWRGIFVIMQTPFHESLEIDEESLRREVDFLCRCGVHGVVWPAGAGETASLSHGERVKCGEMIVKEARGRTTVLLGVQAPNQFEAVQFAREAERAGADGIHALGPMNGSNDQQLITEYFRAITAACKLPLSIQVSSPAMTTDYLLKLADELPTFRIAKEEGSEVSHSVSKYRERKSRLLVHTGGGGLNFLNEMARGSDGTMAGAGFADLQVSIWEWYQAGKKKEARELFSKFIMMAVLERQTGYVLQKEILRRRGIFKTVTMRSTRRFTMDAGDLRELDEIMEVCRPYFRV